jgi:hypothetical protein
MNNMVPTLFCSSSRTLPSSRTSLIDDMDPVVRPVLLTPAVDLVVVGGFELAAERLCRVVTGGFLILSDTEARGLTAVDCFVPVSVGETTPCREEVVGFVVVDADTDLEI